MHGLVCLVDGLTHSLPLVRVVVEASPVDVSAQVVVRQLYKNDGTLRTDCSYQFPVPARAAVTAFALVKEDGSRVVGVVQEKEEARITYDEAVKEGKLSSLMEQASPDTFTTSVGNILPNELVTVELTYVTELTEGDSNDSIRFHVPAHVGCRYGDSPSMSSVAQPASTTSTFFSVDAKIESVAAITKVNCPSHAVSTELGTDPSLPDADLLPSANHARISCTSNLALSSDFVLEITSAGLDRPRCVVEHHPASDSAAVSLTVVPRFELPEVKGQEWVFLIDRSGSMGSWGAPAGGSGRIGLARKALVVLLRSLPSRDSLFNIVSFGSSHSILWSSGSRAYNQITLDEATKLVDSMEADMGGTEVRRALDSVFKLRDEKRPTSVFVLTDGDVWDLDGVLDSVKTAVSSSSADAPLRVFSLGIGESASTAMVDGLARVGRGIAQYVSDGESFTGKAARLVRAARSPPILNARLDFGVAARAAADAAASPSAPGDGDGDDGFELVEPVKEVVDSVAGEIKSISLFDETVDPLKRDEQTVPPIEPVALPRPAPIQLAPSTLHSLYSGSRLHAYGIVTPASLLGDKVTLRGELATGEQLELDVPLVKMRTSPSADSPSLLHALAARKLIQDLEDGSHVVTSPGTEGDLAARSLKAAVVRLGKQYSLASTHTSFVAVDEADAKRGKVPRAVVHIVEGGGMARFGGGGAGGGFGGAMPLMAMAAPAPAPGGPPPRGLLRSRAAPLATTFAAPPAAAAATMFAAPVPPPPSAPAPRRRTLFRSAAADPPHGHDTSIAPSMAASSSVEPPLTPSFGGESGPSAASSADQNSAPPVAVTPADRLEKLARAQAFDGSFGHAALAALPDVPSFEALPEQVRARACEGVRATLAVLAFFERGVAGEEEEAWAGMAEKARTWVADELGASDEEVQGWVEALK
ncbi:hypothetical protein JCM9279_001914 [Rhodotorula babjevae]